MPHRCHVVSLLHETSHSKLNRGNVSTVGYEVPAQITEISRRSLTICNSHGCDSLPALEISSARAALDAL